ncbi:hypothetical protein [Saccharospirillum salsuginis]|uniref:Uncharacterized protein n=1 Tax=Saccharospirillum salsuginis TaxID=418750 RepID=A0A918NA44_9GAMM|nr:hypothetical protein [Saccharospirillum salsuginis]GGX57730.1 hypothetical protein GCM10007392_26690 [Saccharospirillum salsuginis]
MSDIRDRFEKGLGLASVAMLIAMVALPLVNYLFSSVFGIRWLTNASGDIEAWFFLVLNGGALLSTLIFLWPYSVSRTSGRSFIRHSYLTLVVAQVALVVGVAISTYWMEGATFSGGSYIYSAFLWVMFLLFVGLHYFLYQVVVGYLASGTARAISLGGFVAIALWFVLYWVPEPILRRLSDSMLFGQTPVTVGMDLFGVLFGIMQYLFVALIPFYLVSLVSKKQFYISPWMHVVYAYSGITGGAGYFAVVYTLMGSG